MREAIPQRYADGRRATVITPADLNVFGLATIVDNARASGSAAWAAASRPLAIPFRVSAPFVVTHLGWVNGSAPGSNHDIGIYRSDFSRVVSAGSTAGSGTSAWQWVDIADTALATGDYYLVKCVDATTGNRITTINHTADARLLTLMGVKEGSAASFALPDPLTSMGDASAFTRIPLVAMTTRAPF